MHLVSEKHENSKFFEPALSGSLSLLKVHYRSAKQSEVARQNGSEMNKKRFSKWIHLLESTRWRLLLFLSKQPTRVLFKSA